MTPGNPPPLRHHPTRAARLALARRRRAVLRERQFAHHRQIPEKLFDVTLQPLMFVLLFSFVFGNVSTSRRGDYREYLIAASSCRPRLRMMGPGSRWRPTSARGSSPLPSLPMCRPAYLLGHFSAEFSPPVPGDRDHGPHG